MRDGSRGIPSWRGILRRRCRRYSVMVALAHFGQVPPMGIHILALLRFSLAYHPFHTRCDAHSLSPSPGSSVVCLFPLFLFSSLSTIHSRSYVPMREVNTTLATTMMYNVQSTETSCVRRDSPMTSPPRLRQARAPPLSSSSHGGRWTAIACDLPGCDVE